MLDIELFGHIHRFFIHPDQHRFEVTVFHRQIIRMYQHFATGNVDFVFQSNGNALGRESIIQFAIVSNDTFHFRCFAWRQSHHRISFTDDTAGDLTAEATEVQVRTQYILYRITEIFEITILVDWHCFQEIQQRRSFIPGSAVALIHHIIAIQSRKRDISDIRNIQGFHERLIISDNLIEYLFVEVDQVHFIHSQYHMFDPQQRNQISVAAGLRNYTGTGIYQDNSQVGSRTAGYHVTGILFMSRSIGDDKLTVVRTEITVSHVDRNTLFTFGLQAVKQ